MWLGRTRVTFAEIPWPARLGWGLLGCSFGRSWAMVSVHQSSSRSLCSGLMLFTYLHNTILITGHACILHAPQFNKNAPRMHGMWHLVSGSCNCCALCHSTASLLTCSQSTI